MSARDWSWCSCGTHSNGRPRNVRTTPGGRVVPSNAARAVGRFNPNGTEGYRSSLGGPLRATRTEAEGDWIAEVES